MNVSSPDTQGLSALPFCVARITAGVMGNAMARAHGTGFFYNFHVPGGQVACLVSNKHILINRPWIEIGFGEQDGLGGRALNQPTRLG